MLRLKFSSPGVLLIFAVIASGGVYLLDLFSFGPYMASQQAIVLSERAVRLENIVKWALRAEERRLAALCGIVAHGADSAGAAGRDVEGSLRDAFSALKDVDAAWVCDADGQPVLQWRSDGKKFTKAVIADTIIGLGVSSSGAGTPNALSDEGLIKLAGEIMVFARYEGDGDAGDKTSSRWFYLARRLDSRLLSEFGTAAAAELMLVGRAGLGADAPPNNAGQRSVWPVDEDGLAVAWPAKDAAGNMLGFFRAKFSIVQTLNQATIVRRAVLTSVSLSASMIIMVVLGASILLANPMGRLLKRIRQIDAGEFSVADLTRGLHAEPLALAKRLQHAFEVMDRVSRTDELTGLANRRQFDQRLNREYTEARRYHNRLSVIVADLDLFKAINDIAGHDAGDGLLRDIAEIIRGCCREVDLPARFGGDEFTILLPETSAASAEVVAERIRQAVTEHTAVIKGAEVSVTMSLGIADFNSGRVEKPNDLVVLADRALYAAKQLGRNRFVQACDLDESMWLADGHEGDRIEALRSKFTPLDIQLKALFVRALQDIVQVMERRNPYMADHARKVQHFAVVIARKMGMSEDAVRQIELSSLLHDVGMLALPDSVVLCQGRLDDRQIEAMRRHPIIGARILEGMGFVEGVIPAVRSHHERSDGVGYPDGLSGCEIPISARVIAVADTFDAMTSPRTFRGAKSISEALGELQAGAGSQFDPAVVAAFIEEANRLGESIMQIPLPHSSSHANKPELQSVPAD